MFVSCGVEHHGGTFTGHDVVDPFGILDVTDHRLHPQTGKTLRQFLLQCVQGQFRQFEEHQFLRFKACNLAAQFRTDRAACSAHHHDLPRQQPMQAAVIEPDGIAPQQIIKLNPPQARHGHPASHQIFERGNGENVEPRPGTNVGDHFPDIMVGRRQRQHHVIDIHAARKAGDIFQRSQNGNTLHEAPLLFAAVVQQSHHVETRRVARQFAEQKIRRRPGARNQNGPAARIHHADKVLFLPRAVRQTTAPHHQQQQDGVKYQYGMGNLAAVVEQGQYGRHQQRRNRDRLHDALQVGQAGETPDSAIKAKMPENERLHRHHPDQCREGSGHQFRRHGQIGIQPIRAHPGQYGHEDVVENNGNGTGTDHLWNCRHR